MGHQADTAALRARGSADALGDETRGKSLEELTEYRTAA
jgi:hypothetical protein